MNFASFSLLLESVQGVLRRVWSNSGHRTFDQTRGPVQGVWNIEHIYSIKPPWGRREIIDFFFSFLFLCVASKLCVCVLVFVRLTLSERERETHLFESMKLSWIESRLDWFRTGRTGPPVLPHRFSLVSFEVSQRRERGLKRHSAQNRQCNSLMWN